MYANKPWGKDGWELYNIAKDRTESRDLADENPQKLGEMIVAWKQYVAETGTLEIEGLAYRPGYSNAGKYYDDLAKEADSAPHAKPQAKP